MTPFELMDYVGLDIVLHTQEYFAETLSTDYTPRKALLDAVTSGTLGKKTGKGLYDWSAGRPTIDMGNATKEFDFTHLIALQVNEATKSLKKAWRTTLRKSTWPLPTAAERSGPSPWPRGSAMTAAGQLDELPISSPSRFSRPPRP